MGRITDWPRNEPAEDAIALALGDGDARGGPAHLGEHFSDGRCLLDLRVARDDRDHDIIGAFMIALFSAWLFFTVPKAVLRFGERQAPTGPCPQYQSSHPLAPEIVPPAPLFWPALLAARVRRVSVKIFSVLRATELPSGRNDQFSPRRSSERQSRF